MFENYRRKKAPLLSSYRKAEGIAYRVNNVMTKTASRTYASYSRRRGSSW